MSDRTLPHQIEISAISIEKNCIHSNVSNGIEFRWIFALLKLWWHHTKVFCLTIQTPGICNSQYDMNYSKKSDIVLPVYSQYADSGYFQSIRRTVSVGLIAKDLNALVHFKFCD